MIVFLLFIIGLCVGSFLNVLIDRIPNDESPLAGRSYCDHCKKTLRWHNMVPLLSFALLKGKCRYCRTSISFYYPLVELVTGIMFVIVFFFLIESRIMNHESWFTNFEFIINYFYYALILSSFIVIFFTDLKYGIIPDKIVYPAVAAAAIFNFQFSIFNFIFSAIGAFIFFLLLYLITRGKGMGFGDVKLAFLLGIVLGFPKIIVAFYLAFLTGAIVGSILIIWGKKKLKSAIPFGPFLILGAALSIFFGEKILQLVLHLLNF